MENGQPGTKHTRRRSASVAQLLGGDGPPGISSTGGASTSHAHGLRDDEERDQGKAFPGRDSSSDWEMNEMLSDDNFDDDDEAGLTNGDKDQRRQRKRTNTLLLHERIANGGDTRALEEKIAVQSFWRNATINGVLIALWYTFSISISVVSL